MKTLNLAVLASVLFCSNVPATVTVIGTANYEEANSYIVDVGVLGGFANWATVDSPDFLNPHSPFKVDIPSWDLDAHGGYGCFHGQCTQAIVGDFIVSSAFAGPPNTPNTNPGDWWSAFAVPVTLTGSIQGYRCDLSKQTCGDGEVGPLFFDWTIIGSGFADVSGKIYPDGYDLLTLNVSFTGSMVSHPVQAPVPEPGALVLFSTGLVALLKIRS